MLKTVLSLLSLLIGLTATAASPESDRLAASASFQARYPIHLHPSTPLLDNIGRKLVDNESSCSVKTLVDWNKGEEFASLGLGHTIWYPADQPKDREESFPQLIQFLRKEIKAAGKSGIPAWLDKEDIGPAPWSTLADFKNASGPAQTKISELKNFLSRKDILLLQVKFYVERLRTGIYRILADTELSGDKSGAARIYRNFRRMTETDFGIRSMVDYVNFKGEGLHEGERTDLHQLRWGLKQVLLSMPESAGNANEAFADGADKMLKQIWQDSGPEKKAVREKWYKGGWSNRITGTYRSGHLDTVPCAIFDPAPTPLAPSLPAATTTAHR